MWLTDVRTLVSGTAPDELTRCVVKMLTGGGSIKHINTTLQLLGILLLLCHTPDCICNIRVRVSGYLILPCLWLKAFIIITNIYYIFFYILFSQCWCVKRSWLCCFPLWPAPLPLMLSTAFSAGRRLKILNLARLCRPTGIICGFLLQERLFKW